MLEEPLKLTKRFRYQEENDNMRVENSWTSILLNLDKGTILTRTLFRWLLLIIFYAIFYLGIATLWWSCFWIFEKTTTAERPKWLLSQPGFSFEPATKSSDYLKIEYNEHSEEEVQDIVDHIGNAVRKYGQVPGQYFNTCQAENDYGYNELKPCIFLKINRIIAFKTQPIETLEDLPQDAPLELYEYLQSQSKEQLKQRIWISCESRPQLKFLYFPQRFYHTSAVDGHLNSSFNNENTFERVVAIQSDQISTNIKYHISCFLWAKNIVRDSEGKIGKGFLKFSLKIKSF